MQVFSKGFDFLCNWIDLFHLLLTSFKFPVFLYLPCFLLRQTNVLLSPNSRCGWTQPTNRTMRRAFGPSQSHAFFFSLGPPFCTEGWASPLPGSGHVWMCSSCHCSFVFLIFFYSIHEFVVVLVSWFSHFTSFAFSFLIQYFFFLISTLRLEMSLICTSSAKYFVFLTFFGKNYIIHSLVFGHSCPGHSCPGLNRKPSSHLMSWNNSSNIHSVPSHL